MTEYSNALEYLYGLEKFGMVFGLENIEWILDRLGNPHHGLKIVHVGGTNGKGSVACMVSGILAAGGYSVGMYTSPHLVSFTERIVVNGVPVKEEEVAELTGFIRDRAERVDPDRFFTFFDFTTALAFEYFRRKQVDIAVVEVGLGGRLDSTNVVQPLLSIITNVDLDHMDCLGDTIADIAREKAGIIKADVPIVTGADQTAKRVIEETARKQGSSIYCLGRDFSYEKTAEQVMTFTGPWGTMSEVHINLLGDHQLANGAIALCAAGCLSDGGFPVTEESARKALSRVAWPGRLEIVRENPLIVLDAAHNPQGVHALAEYVATRCAGRRKILIFGVMKDKEYPKMIKELVPLFDSVILTRPNVDRALSPDQLKRYVNNAHITQDVGAAVEKAKAVARDTDLILITGSFYTIGEAKTRIDEIF
jgi:dihydrofolate synthase / folylpolyglutamate synthase